MTDVGSRRVHGYRQREKSSPFIRDQNGLNGRPHIAAGTASAMALKVSQPNDEVDIKKSEKKSENKKKTETAQCAWSATRAGRHKSFTAVGSGRSTDTRERRRRRRFRPYDFLWPNGEFLKNPTEIKTLSIKKIKRDETKINRDSRTPRAKTGTRERDEKRAIIFNTHNMNEAE